MKFEWKLARRITGHHPLLALAHFGISGRLLGGLDLLVNHSLSLPGKCHALGCI